MFLQLAYSSNSFMAAWGRRFAEVRAQAGSRSKLYKEHIPNDGGEWRGAALGADAHKKAPGFTGGLILR